MDRDKTITEVLDEMERKARFLDAQYAIWYERAERLERTLRAMDLKLLGYQDSIAADLRRMITEALDHGA
jgi:hypothetical protein